MAIAHDLRQPVAAITAYANLLEVLAEQHSADPQGQAGAKHILASSRQLHRLIGDLLDVSRLAAGQLKLERRSLALLGLVNDVVERMAETLRGHAVRVDVQNAIPSIELDSGRVEQALTNLLSNATKYGYAGTAILVQLRSQDDEVQVSVVNQGKGIALGDMPHLFNRFYRAREAPSTGEAGLGLGLYITKEIVEAHGGRIWAESDPGRTATFRFTLPVARAESTPNGRLPRTPGLCLRLPSAPARPLGWRSAHSCSPGRLRRPHGSCCTRLKRRWGRRWRRSLPGPLSMEASPPRGSAPRWSPS